MNKYDFLKQVYKSNQTNKCYLDGKSIEFIEKELNKLSRIEEVLDKGILCSEKNDRVRLAKIQQILKGEGNAR